MIARLLISASSEARVEETNKILSRANLKKTHPDVLYLEQSEKLGIAEARLIKQHFALKPYSAKGRVVVLEDASNLTIEAQNALLKTLEEPPKEAMLILGAPSDANLLPTIISRCEVVILTLNLIQGFQDPVEMPKQVRHDIEKLINSNMEDRFEYVANLKEKEQFLRALTYFFRDKLLHKPNKETAQFLKELLQAEKWAKQNVNIRAILEYLMLSIPSKL